MKLSTRFAAVALACAAIYGREARAQIIIGSGGGGSGGGGGGVVQGSGMAGAPAGGVLTVQGSPSGTPIPVTGSFSAAAAAPTIGATKTMTGNSSCATVWLAGQNGASFFFSSGGSLATTLTPVVYDDATQSGNGCTGGTAIPISFIDPLTAATSSTLVVSNVNVGTLLNLRTGTALCAAVCTASSGTTGTATGFLVASSQVLPAAASGSGGGAVNITQINGTTVLTGAGVSGAGAMRVAAATSDGNVLATANTGRLQVDVVTGGGSNASVGATGSATPASATFVAANLAGTLTGLTATANGLKVDGSAVTQPISGAVTVSSGSITATQATGTNLHAVIDSGSTTIATQATGTNLHTVTDTGSITAVTGTVTVSGTVTTTPPANASTNIAQVGGSSVVTAATGVQKVGVTGNAGAALDATGQNAASPANELLIAGQFNTSPTTITSGNVSPLQLDSSGNVKVNIIAGASSGAVAQGSTTSGQTGGLIQAASTSAAPSYSNATTNPLSTDLAGNLRVSAGAPANVSTTGTISAQCTNGNINTACTSGRVTINVTGQAGATFKLVNANVTQTGYVIDCSYDNAATWETGNAILDSTTAPSANLSFTTDSTTTYWSAICRKANPNFIGLRASAAITNSSTVTWTAGLVPGGPTLFTSTPGGATPQQLVVVQGSSTGTAVGVGGTVASGGSNAGNPIKEGFVAHTALPTAGTDNQIFDGMADKFGRTVTVANGDRALITEGALITLTASTAETTLLTAGGANVLLDLTYWHCDNSSATAVTVSFRDATAGTVRDTYAIPAGGSNGAVLQVPWKQNAANGNWTVQSSASVTSLFCRAQAVQNK